MDKILYLRDVERVIKDYFIECVNADMNAVELTEANAELCRRMEGVAFGLPGSRELQDLLCKVECIGGEELGNCPERRFGRCRSIARLESCQIHAITDYLLANGVVAQEWISVKDQEEPTENGTYLCHGYWFGSRRKQTETADFCGEWNIANNFILTHWMPLPQPPKGE